MVDWHTWTSAALEAADAKLGGGSFVNLGSIGDTFFQVSVNKVLLIKVAVIHVCVYTACRHSSFSVSSPSAERQSILIGVNFRIELNTNL